MVHRTMGLPHKSEPKNSYCVIWVQSIRNENAPYLSREPGLQTHLRPENERWRRLATRHLLHRNTGRLPEQA